MRFVMPAIRAGILGPYPDGEWISWVIVESNAGVRNVRAIAAVNGIGVL